MNEELYLCHHGVKGMHWGVRRYQNEDGSLTNKGKRKYMSDGHGGYVKMTRKNLRNYNYKNGSAYKNSNRYQKGNISRMNDIYKGQMGSTAAKRIAARRDNGLTEKQAKRGEAGKAFVASMAVSMLAVDLYMFGGSGTKFVTRQAKSLVSEFAKAGINRAYYNHTARKARQQMIGIGAKKLQRVAKNVYQYV